MDKPLFDTRYRRDILETETRNFNGDRKEITFAISNALLDDPDYSDKGHSHLHKNTLLKSIFILAKSFRDFDRSEVVRDLLALRECCTKDEPSETDTDS